MSIALGITLALSALNADETPRVQVQTKEKAKAKTPPKPGASSVPIDRKPYKIKAWISVDPHARLDRRGRDALIADWKALVQRFVGQPWELDVDASEGPLLAAGGDLDALKAEDVGSLAAGFDKAWVIRIGPGGNGLSIAGREYDTPTALLGLIGRRAAPSPEDAPRSLLRLALDLFTPTAEIGESSAGGVSITVQGGSLPAADPVGQVVKVGSVFHPARVLYSADLSKVEKVMPVKATYLRVESLEGPVARCAIISALRNPLTKRVIGINRMRDLALGLKPSAIPTRLRFVTNTPERTPAAGYTLISRPAPDGLPREVGTTDREGRIVLEPRFDDNLVILRLVAANIEPLIEFPVMPGEHVEEQTFKLEPKMQTVTIEARLNALRDQIVDLVAVRARLSYLLKARAESENWEDVRSLLDEYKKLTTRKHYEEEVAKLEKELVSAQDKTPKKPVRTRQAQFLFTETHALIERYLDDEDFAAYEDAYSRWQAEVAKATAAGSKVKAGVVALPKGMQSPGTPPSNTNPPTAPPETKAQTAAAPAGTPKGLQAPPAPPSKPATQPKAAPPRPPTGNAVPF